MGQTHLFRISKPRSSDSQDQLHPGVSFPAPSLFCCPLWPPRTRTSCLRLCSNLSWLVTGWVTLGKFLNLSVPQFPQSESNSPGVPEAFPSSHSTWLSQGRAVGALKTVLRLFWACHSGWTAQKPALPRFLEGGVGASAPDGWQ